MCRAVRKYCCCLDFSNNIYIASKRLADHDERQRGGGVDLTKPHTELGDKMESACQTLTCICSCRSSTTRIVLSVKELGVLIGISGGAFSVTSVRGKFFNSDRDE